MAYRDTTRFAKVRDKREWPDNWAKTAPPAPFWQEVVTGVPMELKTRWNPVGSLEDTMASMGRQYGRRAGLYVLWRYIALQEPLDLILTDLLDSWAVRLRDEDLAELQALVPNEDPALVAEAFAQMRSTAAHNVEGTTRETYGK
jgi:hypothetical protein